MFLDASALVALVQREPGFETITRKLDDCDSQLFYSPLVRFESILALSRTKGAGRSIQRSAQRIAASGALFDGLMERLDAKEIPISSEVGMRAVSAFSDYGKARGHPARLNLGDCFAYACAKTLGVGLIYKGNDFARTDLA